jgi:carboxyl-terminal processing protease
VQRTKIHATDYYKEQCRPEVFLMRINRPGGLLPVIPILVALFVFSISTVRAEAPAKPVDPSQFKLFREAMLLVHEKYVKDVSDKELVRCAINGMLQSLDPHSSFLDPQQFKGLQDEMRNAFAGLGIELTLESRQLTVLSPIDDTPASKAGLQPGDKIVKINGESTKSFTLEKAVKLMRGTKGSKVTLTIKRAGLRDKDYTLTRDIIRLVNVKKELIESGLPYIKIAGFHQDTDTDLEAAISAYGGDKEIKGLILDLRNNPGGLLDQAVKVSQLFLDKGIVVFTDGRLKENRTDFPVRKAGRHHKFKVAVLINEGSASASEIVAGALQDHERAVVFGTKSFGKASVQTIMPLENGSGLRLTTAYYYTPKGRHIQKTGIIPDIDMDREIRKQQDDQAEQEKIDKNRRPKSRLKQTKADIENDPVVKRALQWLKTDMTVEQFKSEYPRTHTSDTGAVEDSVKVN